jgi:alpha-ketoglutarate-dependent taurine dioxygenase
MTNVAGPAGPSIKNFNVRRRAVSSSQEGWVKTEPLAGDWPTRPLVARPAVEGVDLVAWGALHGDFVRAQLREHGAVLFRGFEGLTAERFEEFIRGVSGELLEYNDRATPRSEVSGRVYSSTDYPPEHHIELHNESSYAFNWPRHIFFYCAQAAPHGGETPIADCRRVYRRLDPALRERFESKGVMYVRNFGDVFGMAWQTVFQTEEMDVALDYCRRNRIEFERREGGRLRTWQVRGAVVEHPETGDTVWFNQATSFHLSTLEPSVRQALLEQVKEEDVPKNAYYGDGTRIEDSVLDELRAAYREETVAFPWESGDVLMLDNILMAHGRRPFSGPRRVLAGMAGLANWDMVRGGAR